ncbi:MAG: hypothetical protein Ct9H300mP28_17930 [Pseudomonadota bacterium]|nr:MAG: hypothetical protein Ct9H300mP28_17930 [Pseudomonadota bacterium]
MVEQRGQSVMPGSSSSHHLHTLPGMLIAIREMAEYGHQYASQTVANAKAFGQALTDEGVNVEAEEFCFTESHQLALNVTNFGDQKQLPAPLQSRTTSSPIITFFPEIKTRTILPV